MRKAATKPRSRPLPPKVPAPVAAQLRFPVWLPALLLGLVTILAYQPVWHAGFIWEDDNYVTANRLLTAPDGLGRIWFSFDSPSQYFPLVYSAFRLEHLLWGFNAAGYHWANLLLHVANALLLWRLLARLEVPGAFLAAAIFALHPVEVESVAWITELKNVLMLFFFLLTLLAWVEFLQQLKMQNVTPINREQECKIPYGLALIFYALALCAKTTACTLPAALLLIVWWRGMPITRRRLVEVLPFVTLGIGMGLLTVWWERYHQGTQGKLFTMGWLDRVLLANRAVWFYVGKLVWPVNLTFSYPRWTISATDPSAYLWLLALAVLGAAIYMARRRAGRGIEVAVLFFVTTLSPVLGFIMLYTFRYSFVADHYQYVASIGLIALASATLASLAKAMKPRRKWLEAMVFMALPLALGALTWQQAHIYADEETLWRDTLTKNPASWLAMNNLGSIQLGKGQTDEAIRLCQAALSLAPDDAEAHYNLGTALYKKGRTDDAISEYNEALNLNPYYVDARINLGIAFVSQGQSDVAIRVFQEALRLAPDSAEAHYNLGVALRAKGRIDEAISEYQEAIRLKPDYAEAHNNLGNALSRQGRIDEAIGHLKEAIHLKPDYAEAHNNLGVTFGKKGEAGEAIGQFQEAVRLKPDDADLRFNLGIALGGQGRLDEAISQFQEAVRLKPDFAAARDNLNRALELKDRENSKLEIKN